MKKLLSLTLLGFSLATPLYANVVDVGLQLGINLSFASLSRNSLASQASNGAPRYGLVVNPTVTYPLTNGFELQSGLRYAEKGANVDIVGILPGLAQLDYLDLPVLVRWTAHGQRMRFVATGGLFVGVAVKRQMFLVSLIETSLENRMKGMNYGAELGAGIEYQLNENLRLTAHSVFEIGLMDIDDNANEFLRTRGLYLLVGLVSGIVLADVRCREEEESPHSPRDKKQDNTT